MILPDINLLLYAHRSEMPPHAAAGRRLDGVLAAQAAFALSDEILAAVVRFATNRRMFGSNVSPLDVVLAFVEGLRSAPNAVVIRPGSRHWHIFVDLCRRVGATANDVADAFLAALAIESGCELNSTDAGFARFPGLVGRNPLAP